MISESNPCFFLLINKCCAEHKYPYDWRTKKPTIFRATEQWFASVEGFRDAAMDAINQVTWIPSQVFVILLRLSDLLKIAAGPLLLCNCIIWFCPGSKPYFCYDIWPL